MPEDCPPQEATQIEQSRVFFRLVAQFPPAERDFESVWSLQQSRRKNLDDECTAKGISLFDTPDAAEAMTKLRPLADKIVCKVNITPESGMIIQGRSHHYTWWPFSNYDILAQCSEYAR